jgi:peptidoglycan/xylan/chitin deacetylase (PgdA/CDA1 family)
VSDYPWYWRLKGALPTPVKQGARRAVDRVAAAGFGSVNRGGRSGVMQACLTLDDGPDPVVTPGVLAALAARDMYCTFFLLTDRAARFPQLTREIVAAGHEVALHGQDHRPVAAMSAGQAERYLRPARDQLQDIAGQAVTWYRPPYGSQSIGSYRGARRAGLDVVVWSSDADDWVDAAAPAVVDRALVGATPGAIMLFHERLEPHPVRGAPTTSFDRVAVIGAILDGMRERGLTQSTVGALAERRRTAWFRP